MNKLTALLMIIVAVVSLAAGLWFGQDKGETAIKPAVIQGAIYPLAKNIQDFNLLDQNSHDISKQNFLNHWSLIFIGYTHCPDVCPTTLAVLNQVDEFMVQQNIMPPQMVFLSIDPERDTVDVMKPYINYFNKKFIALTGSINEIKKLTQQLNAVYRKAEGASGDINNDDYLMDHSSALMLINPDGNLQSILTAPHTPANIIDSIINSQMYYEAINK